MFQQLTRPLSTFLRNQMVSYNTPIGCIYDNYLLHSSPLIVTLYIRWMENEMVLRG